MCLRVSSELRHHSACSAVTVIAMTTPSEPLSKKPRTEAPSSSPSSLSPAPEWTDGDETELLRDIDEEALMNCSPQHTVSNTQPTSSRKTDAALAGDHLKIPPPNTNSFADPPARDTPRDATIGGCHWKRPPPPNINPSTDPLIFQQIDVDHYTGGVLPGMPGAQQGPVPILRMFGVTDNGNSVCAHVHGFLPYFYVPAPGGFCDDHCALFRRELDRKIMGDLRSNRDNLQEAVLAVDMCRKCSIYGFYFNEKTDFLKITLSLPRLVAPARRLVNDIHVPPFGQIHYQVTIQVVVTMPQVEVTLVTMPEHWLL